MKTKAKSRKNKAGLLGLFTGRKSQNLESEIISDSNNDHVIPEQKVATEIPSTKEVEQSQPDTKKPQKERRKVVRLCRKCCNYFNAHRSDASYCSSSCRQMAHKKGIRHQRSENPPEHYLIKAIRFYIDDFLKLENMELSKKRVDNLFYKVNIARPLFINEINSEHHLVIFYEKHIEGFIIYLNRQFKTYQCDTIIMDIPESTREIWLKFLDAVE